jgi:hypothetical protein
MSMQTTEVLKYLVLRLNVHAKPGGLGNDKAQLTSLPHFRAALAKGPIFAWRIIIPVRIVSVTSR